MDTLVDSIRGNGILNPVIVRPDENGNYEMISGHRRLHAARIVGLKKIPAIVKEMSDDEAIIKWWMPIFKGKRYFRVKEHLA